MDISRRIRSSRPDAPLGIDGERRIPNRPDARHARLYGSTRPRWVVQSRRDGIARDCALWTPGHPGAMGLTNRIRSSRPVASWGWMVSVASETTRALDTLASMGVHASQTLAKLAETTSQLTRFLAVTGVDSLTGVSAEVAARFVSARLPNGEPPSVATRHLRRTNLRLLFRAARIAMVVSHDPTIDLTLPARTIGGTRPLTDEEVVLCRVFARHVTRPTRQPAVWALAEATATTGEMPHITRINLDLDNGLVLIHGGRHTDPRIGRLTDWGITALRQRVATTDLDDSTPIVNARHRGSLTGPQASAAQAIYKIFERAGLATEPDIRASSIGAWTARRLFDQTGDIAAVAKALGVSSLDVAARRIGWDWQATGARQ